MRNKVAPKVAPLDERTPSAASSDPLHPNPPLEYQGRGKSCRAAQWQSVVAGLLTILLTAPAFARNVDLSTVPKRDSVQLTIYNSEDITLVRETRTLTFRKGVNPLEFSWANTLIDPTSVELKFISSPEKLEVLDTTFPHDKPQMLYWNVQSDFDGEATVEITYFTSGITWKADYLAIADQTETQASVEGFVRIFNHSGEQYDGAHIRLVVGTINLVQKIAELAQMPMEELGKLDQAERRSLERDAAKDFLRAKAEGAAMPSSAPMPDEKQIIKQGLSEYFIFSIEGTETIPDGWSKRMRSLDAASVPFKVTYRYRPAEYGEDLVRLYLLTNNKESKLGGSPLPDGIVRVFRDNGRDGLSYLVTQHIKYVPVGDKIEMNLGPDPRVMFELIKLRASRDNIWMRLNGADIFRRVDDGADLIEVRSSVAGFDAHEVYTQRIRNYTDKAIDVEIRRTIPGDITFRSRLTPTLHDYQTVELKTSVEAASKADLLFELVHHEGRNAHQNNVTLEVAGEPVLQR